MNIASVCEREGELEKDERELERVGEERER